MDVDLILTACQLETAGSKQILVFNTRASFLRCVNAQCPNIEVHSVVVKHVYFQDRDWNVFQPLHVNYMTTTSSTCWSKKEGKRSGDPISLRMSISASTPLGGDRHTNQASTAMYPQTQQLPHSWVYFYFMLCSIPPLRCRAHTQTHETLWTNAAYQLLWSLFLADLQFQRRKTQSRGLSLGRVKTCLTNYSTYHESWRHDKWLRR